jgi:hypothetical protein
MSQRRRRFGCLGVALAAAFGVFYAACYDPAEPACGFRCGPNNACPDDYACASDGVCHRSGTAPDLVCLTPDAPLADTPEDVPGDGPNDAVDASDAPADVPIDVPPDAAIDGGTIDAAVDAAPDA